MITFTLDQRNLLGCIEGWLWNEHHLSHSKGEYYHIWNHNKKQYELTLNPKKGTAEHLETLIRLKFL